MDVSPKRRNFSWNPETRSYAFYGLKLIPASQAEMKKTAPSFAGILNQLEKHYGEQLAVGPGAPYEGILFLNCGYPATDASCSKGYEALEREVGTKPEEILAAPQEKLARLMRVGASSRSCAQSA
jgi:hypothetical protein